MTLKPRICDDARELPREFQTWQRKMLRVVVSVLLLITLVGGGSWYTIWRQPDEVVEHLPQIGPEVIRARLEQTIEVTYDREIQEANRLRDEQQREELIKYARKACERRLSDVDALVESITETVTEGRASPDYVEFVRTMDAEGVDAALAYVDTQWPRLLGEVAPDVANIAQDKSDVRRRLAPCLESVRLLALKGDHETALTRCMELLAKDSTWAEVRYVHVSTLIELGDKSRRYRTLDAARDHFKIIRDSAWFVLQSDPTDTKAKRVLSASYNRLGVLSQQAGQADQAIQYHIKALQVREQMAEADPNNAEAKRSLSVSYDHLGDLSQQTGQLEQSLEYFNEGFRIRLRLVEADPSDAQAKRDLSIACERIAGLSQQAGQLGPSLFYHDKALQIRLRLAEADPNNEQAMRDLSTSYDRLGDLSQQTRQLGQAFEYYDKGLQIREQLAEADFGNEVAKLDLSTSYDHLGDLSQQMGQPAQSLEYYHKGLQIREQLVDAHPDNAVAKRDLSVSYHRLGAASRQTGQLDQAVFYHNKALQIRLRLAEADPNNERAKRDLMLSHCRLGQLFQERGDLRRAFQEYEQGATLLHEMSDDRQFLEQSDR